MKTLQKRIDKFFNDYETRFQNVLKGKKLNLADTVNAFAECFVEASPLGINCGKNDSKFKAAIPKGYEFYKSIGTRTMKIIKKETTFLDELHIMVNIYWSAEYVKANNSFLSIDFNIIYFLQDRENELKIFAYITGDEQKVLKENGLLT